MLEHAEQVNSRPAEDANHRKKCALDGMWSTLVNSTNVHDIKAYMEKSPKVMTEIIPPIVNNAVRKYEHSQTNLVRSVGVLYEGGISSKKQYNRKHSRDIVEVDEHGKKHQTTFMHRCKVPKLMDYKRVMQFVESVDIGQIKDIPRAKKSNSEKVQYKSGSNDENSDLHDAVSGCYRELEPFLINEVS